MKCVASVIPGWDCKVIKNLPSDMGRSFRSLGGRGFRVGSEPEQRGTSDAGLKLSSLDTTNHWTDAVQLSTVRGIGQTKGLQAPPTAPALGRHPHLRLS